MSDQFAGGRRGAVIPPDPRKQRITIRLDADVVAHFKRRVLEAGGGNYQTLINAALRRQIEQESQPLERVLRRIIREELARAG